MAVEHEISSNGPLIRSLREVHLRKIGVKNMRFVFCYQALAEAFKDNPKMLAKLNITLSSEYGKLIKGTKSSQLDDLKNASASMLTSLAPSRAS